MEECLAQNTINGSDNVKVYATTSRNEGAAAVKVDMLANYVCLIRCFVHTVALCLKDVFNRGTLWKSYMDQANDVTTYFDQHQKTTQMPVALQF